MADQLGTSLPKSQITTTTTLATTTTSIAGSRSMLLREAVLTRHSSRLFLPTPVPRPLIDKALELAKHSPSDSNTQPWRLFIATGDGLKRLKTELYNVASKHENLQFAPLPEEFQKYRIALGAKVYGEGWGLKKGDQRNAVLSNYEFFGAPIGIVVCMNRSLKPEQVLNVGFYLQTFVLALTELGLSSCVEFSVSYFPDTVAKAVGVPDDMKVLCGMSVGYEDTKANVNKIRSDRDPVDEHTVWVDK